jgi:guanyl-specific ribonuclease Sa
LLLLGAALVLAACGTQKEDESQVTPSAAPEQTATVEAATPSSEIREVDFSQVPAVEELLAASGSRLAPDQIIFADLTGDGVDEAVVPISTGGSAGNFAYAVFGYQGGDLEELLVAKPEAGRVTVSVEDGVLVETQPIYAPEDPFCCPSQLRHIYYRWDGSELVVDHQTTEKAPSAKP